MPNTHIINQNDIISELKIVKGLDDDTQDLATKNVAISASGQGASGFQPDQAFPTDLLEEIANESSSSPVGIYHGRLSNTFRKAK